MVLKALDQLNAAAARFADMTGFTGHFTAYLGDRRGNVIASASERKVYYFTDQMQAIGEAVLSEGCGITLQSAPRLIGIGIRLAFPPGQVRGIGTPSIIGFSREGMSATGGSTVIEQQLNNATFPNTNQLGPLRVTPTNPASTSLNISVPFIYRNITGAFRVFKDPLTSLATTIAALTSGQHQLAILTIDASTEAAVWVTNTASSASGTLPSRGEFTINDVLSITITPHRMPVLAVYLYYGQADVGITAEDCYYAWDLRPFMGMFQPVVTTTEGDLVVRGSSNVQRLAIGSNNQVLTVDTAVSGKVKWAAGATVVTTTEGDMNIRGPSADQRLAIGANGYVLTVNTGVSGKIEWAAAGGSGAAVDSALCEGRLTLTTGTFVTTSDVTAATTLYFTPLTGRGSRLALYESSAWVKYTLTEISITNSGLSADKNYDVFVYTSGGSRVLELVAWTNDTTRATALATQDDVYVKSGATERRYIGTVRTDGSSKFEDSYSKRYVYNHGYRVMRPLRWYEATSHTYASSTVRYWNNSSSSIVSFVLGVVDQHIDASGALYSQASNGTTSPTHGLNINVNNAWSYQGFDGTTTSSTSTTVISYNAREHRAALVPQVGYNYIAFLEASSGAPAPTFLRAMINAEVLA